MIGGWGILFDDDDGQMIQDCNNLFSGSQVTFPVEYASELYDLCLRMELLASLSCQFE